MTGYLVFVSNGATLNIMEGSQLLNNQTTAVYVNVNSDLNMSGGAISGNIINNPQEDGYLWGGAGIVNNGTCIVSGGEISNNHTYGYVAGGIRHSRGTFVLEGDASVTKNSADWYGGGIVVEAGAQLHSGWGVDHRERSRLLWRRCVHLRCDKRRPEDHIV